MKEFSFFLCVVQHDGSSPLLIASQQGHVGAVQALLAAGATVNTAKVSYSSVT